MHPAPSLIVFTALSGLGFGALFWLGLGLRTPLGWDAFWFYLLAFTLAVAGLISSTFHLGHPERAWRAFSQWRTSWLSREGVAALATLAVMGLFAIGQVFFGITLWPLGWLGALLAFFTLHCTAMIYASIRAVPRWNDWATPLLLIVSGLAGGALVTGLPVVALIGLAILLPVQFYAFTHGDGAFARAGTTLETATGLGRTGPAKRSRVRLFEPPHTGENYLLREMVFTVGRKHRARLRVIALVLAGAVPALVILVGLLAGIGAWIVLPALALHAIGLLAGRWLFYAEAEHVVGLYYGRHQEIGAHPATT